MRRRRITRWQRRLLNRLLPPSHPRTPKPKVDLEQLDPNQVHLQSRHQERTERLLLHVQKRLKLQLQPGLREGSIDRVGHTAAGFT